MREHVTSEAAGSSSALGLRVSRQALVLAFIVLVLILTRFWDLGNRSFCHDESIHAWEAWKLATGRGYVHDPVYHGPFLYHLTAFVFLMFGISDVTARVVAAGFAVGVVLLVWPLRRWLGTAGSLLAMLLLTISPTLMFRGRFIRHDIVVMLSTMVMLVCFFRYLEDRQARWLYIVAAALAVGFCAKANSFINGAILGSFWVLHLLLEWTRTRKPLTEIASFDLVMLLGTLAFPLFSPVLVKVLGFDPLDYSQAGMLRTLSVVLVLLSVSAVVGTWWNQRVWLVSAGIYYAIYILFYTTMFTNARGAATGFVGMLGYWLSQQTVARGGQPWYYYFFLLAVYEFLPSLLAMCGAFYHLVRSGRKRPEPALESAAGELAPTRWVFASLLVYWAITNVTVFAWTAEKMPWQNQHVTLPIALLAGWFLGDVWDRRDWHRLLKDGAARVAVLLAVALLALLVLISSMMSEPGPLSGVSLEQLAVTLRWLLALVMLGGAVLLMYRWGSRLGRRGWIRILVAALVTILIVITLRVALRLSFVNQDYATEFLVYAASTPDTGLVTRELEEMSRRLAGDMELRIAYDDESSWPFVWYLRDFPNSSFFTAGTGLTGEPQVVIVGPGNESKMKSQLSGKYLRRGYRLIWWPNQDVYANLTPLKLWRDLRDPARRSYWWDILWSRKYPQSTTSWPYVQRFALYVRKDVAAQMWDYGPEVAGAGIELPEDEYEKKRVQVAAVAAWGSYGSGEGQFDYPKSMALDSEDNLYVADSYNHRVQVLDANGQFLRQWGVQGSAPGQFQEPWGIAVDTAGYVYVADTWNHRIQKFEGDGAFVNQWGFFGDTGGALGDAAMLYGPRDLAVDMDGNLLVSDTGNKRVLRFTPEGEFLQQWGGAGSLDGQLREPVGLAVDGAGNVLVADTWNQRIQKFTNVGSFLMQWPVLGWEGEGVTNKPYLAADSKGNVYATAPDYHRVVKFDSSGRLLAAWGQFGSDSTSFNMPSDVAVDSQDNVYVLDSANHRVLKFAPAP